MILKKLVTDIPDVFPHVQKELILKPGELKRAAPWGEDDTEDDETDDTTPENDGYVEDFDYSDSDGGDPSAVAKRQRYEICIQCEEEYDVLINDKESCEWHEGELEVDDEYWADHDERCHGPIDTDGNRADHPDGFKWSCCDATGADEGCKLSRHRPNRNKRIKR